MGAQESSVHLHNLSGVIDNQSSSKIQYTVTASVSFTHHQFSELQNHQISQDQNSQSDGRHYVYTGTVQPYSAKYFQCRNPKNQYILSVYALKSIHQEKSQKLCLQSDLKFSSKNSVCIRISSKLKISHLNQRQINQLKLRKIIEGIFLKQSSIIQNPQCSFRLVNFFEDCPFGAKLLFKASQNDFDVRRFYQKFGYIKSVLMICRTNQNKIIGGYSRGSFIPFKQDNYNNEKWKPVHDQQDSSFIFNLNCSDIFPLKQGRNALLYHQNQEQICFGNNQLRINNHSDKKACCTKNLNTNYENKNYKNNLESYKLFNGNESPQFTTKEWEVWQVNFYDDDQVNCNAILAISI